MKNMLKLAVLCLLAVCAAARAQNSPKLVGEKKIMKLGDETAHTEGRGIWCMRLSPDGRRVLYLLRKMYKTTTRDGKQRERRGYKLALRDLTNGKDAVVPVPALFDDDFAMAWLSMTVFDPAGKTLLVPVGQDADKNGYWDVEPPKEERSKPGLYDIASGTLKTLDLEANLIFPTFSPNGKMLVVLALEMKAMKAKVHVTPTDKINFRPLAKAGLIRSICPTSDLMGLVVIAEPEEGKQTPRPGKFVLYDLKADTIKAELADREHARKLDDYNPQWTGDGRYLYYYGIEDVKREGELRAMPITRIWDVKLGKEAGVLADTVPIGPGPGTNTMVLSKGKEQEIVLHVQGDKTLGKGLHSLGDESIRPISTQGKWLLFIRKDDDGTESARMAEITLPKK